MILNLKNRRLNVIGDVHLGKVFKSGVPLDRRGEREEMVWKQFEEELALDADMTIQVGDIFDKFSVSEATVLRAAGLIRQAACHRPGQPIVILRGNHDAVRDADKRSSFDVLAALLDDTLEVTCVDEIPRHINSTAPLTGKYLFIPWCPFAPASQMATYALHGDKFDAVFGHWDVTGSAEHNLIPLKQLREITDTVVTGHDHTPRELDMFGVRVIVTGSMQPYSFAEDPDEKIYHTRPLDTVERMSVLNPAIYHNHCLRIITRPGEIMPTDIDCLQLVEKRVSEDGVDEGDIDVEFDPFNLTKILGDALADAGVDASIAALVHTKLEETRNA